MDMNSKEIGQIIKSRREARGLSQAQLGALIGVKQASIYSIEAGETQRSKFLPEIARELEIAPEAVGLPPEAERSDGMLRERQILEPGNDFPVYSAVEGGAGEVIRSAEAAAWFPRPAPVAHVREAYGMFVVGESMSPEFDPGDIALVNPRLPPLSGKPCIFYTELHGEARATIKRYMRQTASEWVVFQHNPPRGGANEFRLSRKEWGICHRVLGKYYPQ